MFKVGDKIFYPLHGAGKVKSIEDRVFLNERQSYYIIEMPGEVKVMVPTAKAEEILEKPHTEKELSPMEMSIICSNLARGCEKQYMLEESESFRKLAEFFHQKAEPVSNAGTETLLELINHDISVGFPYGKSTAEEQHDRGGLRCHVWAEKVTRMLQSLLTRYEVEGNKMLENTGVYVCTVCGFVFVGDAPPALCPVCRPMRWWIRTLRWVLWKRP